VFEDTKGVRHVIFSRLTLEEQAQLKATYSKVNKDSGNVISAPPT
jgi:hypothetical protein